MAIFFCISIVMLLTVTLAAGSVKMRKQASQLNFDAHARQIVAKMTLDEKIAQLHGIVDKENCRVVPGIQRLGIPALTICNGPAGAGPAGPGHDGKATSLPAPISLAATWDAQAAYIYGKIAGEESALLGNSLLEAPDVNIARTPHNGRTFESFGEDPFLNSRVAVAVIKGIQSCGVIANVKHYAANNQEQDRFKIDEIIEERTLREIYLPAFEASVEEGHVGSVMAAYNKVNGIFCCENDFLLNQVLKHEWNFNGFITSDFGAVHSTIPSAKAGLDLEMPTGIYFGDSLKKAVESGEISELILDDKLIRRYRTMMRFGVWDQLHAKGNIPVNQDAKIAMNIGEEGVVLLKNKGNLLPLKANSIHTIAVIGPFAEQAMTGGGGSSYVNSILRISPADGIRNIMGKNVTIQINDGTNLSQAVSMTKSADVTILMLGDRQTEGQDHSISLDGNQNELAEAILSVNPHAIVVLKTGGPILMPWVNKASAILEAWYPGEEDGTVVADVLFGIVNPSGKLPITFPKNDTDLPTQSIEQYPGVDSIAHYSENLLVGYRWYDTKKIEPLFPFGYGLSYTTFSYTDLKISKLTAAKTVTIEFTITNSGKCLGAEVAQLYIRLPSLPNVPQPLRELKGFRRVKLNPGQSTHVKIELNTRSLSYWDVKSHGWKVASGTYIVSAASSSRDIRLSGKFNVK